MITAAAFIVLGIIFLIVALYTLIIKIPKSRAQVERRSGKTHGVVSNVDVRTYRRKSSSGKYRESKTYKVDLTFNVGGEEYTIKGIPATNVPNQGDAMDVSYNPDKPSDAHIDMYFADPSANKTGGIILLAVAAVLLLIGVIAFMIAF